MTLRQKRLVWIIVMLLGLSGAAGLILYALNRNINLFFIPSDALPTQTTIRLGGIVVPDSIERSDATLNIKFAVADQHHKVWVVYQGILPDLFREGQAVVAIGQVQEDGILHATQILAKHDENYVPRDLEESLQQQQRHYDP